MNIDKIIEEINFDDRGLVPAVVQDVDTKKYLCWPI